MTDNIEEATSLPKLTILLYCAYLILTFISMQTPQISVTCKAFRSSPNSTLSTQFFTKLFVVDMTLNYYLRSFVTLLLLVILLDFIWHVLNLILNSKVSCMLMYRSSICSLHLCPHIIYANQFHQFQVKNSNEYQTTVFQACKLNGLHWT